MTLKTAPTSRIKDAIKANGCNADLLSGAYQTITEIGAAHVTKASVNQRALVLLLLLTMKYKAKPLTIVSAKAVSFSGLSMVERIAKTSVAVTYKAAMLEKTKRKKAVSLSRRVHKRQATVAAALTDKVKLK